MPKETGIRQLEHACLSSYVSSNTTPTPLSTPNFAFVKPFPTLAQSHWSPTIDSKYHPEPVTSIGITGARCVPSFQPKTLPDIAMLPFGGRPTAASHCSSPVPLRPDSHAEATPIRLLRSPTPEEISDAVKVIKNALKGIVPHPDEGCTDF